MRISQQDKEEEDEEREQTEEGIKARTEEQENRRWEGGNNTIKHGSLARNMMTCDL